MYAGRKSLHIPIAIIKLSGLNVFICIYTFCGSCRNKKCLSNKNVRSEHFNCVSYLPVNECISIPLRNLFAQTRYDTLYILYIYIHSPATPNPEADGLQQQKTTSGAAPVR